MTNNGMYFQQAGIFNPETQKSDIIIVGAGSTGSFIALTLAKMGFDSITVWDFDKVEEHNIPNQFYRLSDKDKFKVEALQEIIKDFTGKDIKIMNEKIDENTDLDINLNSIIINCVDNMDARQIVYDLVKDFGIKIVDTRFGAEGFSIHICDLSNTNDKNNYEKSLKLVVADTPCGLKGCLYSILGLASETCNIIKQIDQEQSFVKLLKREMKQPRFIFAN